MDRPEPGQEKPIYCSAQLDLQGIELMDEEFGVKVTGYACLKRKVEVYCYRQETSQREERKGNAKRTVTDYKYTSCWVEAHEMPQSECFRDQKFNINKKAPFKNESFFPSVNATVNGVIKVWPSNFEELEKRDMIDTE